MPKLYEIAEQYKDFNNYLQNMLEQDEITPEDEQMLKDTLESINDSLENKVAGVLHVMKNIQGDIEMFKSEEKRIAARRKAMENQHEGLKQYLFDTLQFNNISEVKAGTFKVKIANSNPSLNIIDPTKIPMRYRTPQPDKVDSRGLLADLKVALSNGESIDGVEIVKDKKHLKIT